MRSTQDQSMAQNACQDAHDPRLERLLAGGPVEGFLPDYGIAGHHLAVFAGGADARSWLLALARGLDRDLLIRVGGDPTSAWLGGPRAFADAEIDEISVAAVHRDGPLAIGEPGSGLAGWRTTHRQARMAYRLAAQASRPFCRYGDAALLAVAAEDGDLAHFLRERFLEPISGGPHRDLSATLRAYLDAAGDPSSAGAALRVSRQTIISRIAEIEERIGRAPFACLAELDIALRLGDLQSPARPDDAPNTARLTARRPTSDSARGRG
jgi:PucR C-terminal helix-turn-helix domain